MTKPPAEKRVLAWDGKQWVRAIWVERNTKEQDTDSDWHDYNEADDTYYWPEGWYEVQTHGGDEMFWHITDGVQEWREIPPAPGDAGHIADDRKLVASEQELRDEIASLKFDLENATESRKLAQQALYDASERFQKEVLQRTAEVSRLLKERQYCEPFGYFRPEPFGWTDCAPDDEGAVALYTAPPKREPLSEEQIAKALALAGLIPEDYREDGQIESLVRAIERAHGIGGQS